ncbi:retinol dehydrogenase 12-like [Tenebrio molitor]|uniref:retinol dehydrogenase 12-like n=1 Tax=Tenebrio molitor TaxID=7067 RepID=UPI0036248D47
MLSSRHLIMLQFVVQFLTGTVLILCVVLLLLAFYLRFAIAITRSNSCLVGKTAIVTGANSGIGYQTALNLASRGCKIIMADVTDMEKSTLDIIEFTNNPNIFAKHLDLSSLKSVRDFASEILKSEDKLDILINNAGIGASEKNRTADGLHPVMQVNYFGHFLLTHLLIGLLKKSVAGRIVFTSSLLAFTNNLSLKNLNFDSEKPNYFDRHFVYGNSKLSMIMAADTLAEKLKGTGVTVNSIHPMLVKTPLFTKTHVVYKNMFYDVFMWLTQRVLGRDSWEGSQGLVHAAVSRQLKNATGKFFGECAPMRKPLKAYNKQFCKDIWDASEIYVGLTPEERL